MVPCDVDGDVISNRDGSFGESSSETDHFGSSSESESNSDAASHDLFSESEDDSQSSSESVRAIPGDSDDDSELEERYTYDLIASLNIRFGPFESYLKISDNFRIAFRAKVSQLVLAANSLEVPAKLFDLPFDGAQHNLLSYLVSLFESRINGSTWIAIEQVCKTFSSEFSSERNSSECTLCKRTAHCRATLPN